MFCGVIWRITIGVKVKSDSGQNGGKDCSSQAEAALAIDYEKFRSACKRGSLDDVETYLSYADFDVNRTRNGSWTGLMNASYHGYTEVVKRLLLHSVGP